MIDRRALLGGLSLLIPASAMAATPITTGAMSARTFGFAHKSTGDSYWNSVSLLVYGTGTNGSTTFTDSSSNAATLTTHGTAQVSTAQSKFGGGAMFLNGSGYVSAPNSALENFGSGDFTVEGWFYPVTLTSQTAAMSRWASSGVAGSNQWIAFFNTTTPTLTVSTDGTNSSFTATGPTLSTGAWSHVAWVRSGNTLTVYTNGVAGTGASMTGTLFSTDGQSLLIGAFNGGSNGPFNGYINDARITKGVARYTANFTPPSAPFPNH